MSYLDEIRTLAANYKDEIIQTRRTIHQNPELSLQEFETATLIRSKLDEMGISWRAIGETGTVGTLPATEPGGYTVALRADIDALPVHELADLPFASKVGGKMHACGHDSHTAMLLGAAKILSSMKKRPNTVVFLFQPAEEIGAGAKLMIAGNALDGVDVIYGSHIWPDFPLGTIGLKDGPLMTGADKFLIRVIGKGGHGSQPERCCDPIPACTAIVDAIHQLKALSFKGDTTMVITVGYIQCGSAMNIIPDNGEISGTIRWLDRETQKTARERIQAIADGSCMMWGCRAEVEFTEACSCTSNTPECAAQAREVLTQLYGKDAVVEDFAPNLGSEDFSYYCDNIPAVFGWVGCRRNDGPQFGLHNPNFVLDESPLEKGAALYAGFACEYRK